MSEYAELKINSLDLISFRNYLDNKIVALFFSEDCLMIKENVRYEPDDEDEEPFTQYIYKTTVRNAKDRFDALGITISHFEELFNSKGWELIDYDALLSHLHIDYDDYDEVGQKRYKKYVTYQKWINSLKKIIKYELENKNISYLKNENENKDLKLSTECDKIIGYTLMDWDSETSYSYGLKLNDSEYPFLLRQILEFCDDKSEIELDFSNLQFWDYDCIPKAKVLNDYIEKTIVLLEGTSDKEILEFSMSILYPHLKDLFYFMDFDSPLGAKRDGGTSYLIKNMKTFYFSKLKSKFIAVFDNDAEGFSSKMQLLNEVKDWPSNMKAICYPILKQFENYPTLSPSGKIDNIDINQKACSIELYLPDFLIKEDGVFNPIVWESRKEIKIDGDKSFLYQGVINNKDKIKKNLVKFKNNIISGKETVNKEDWSKMKLLLESIVFCFR